MKRLKPFTSFWELSVGQALGLWRPLRRLPQIDTQINSGAESPAQAEGLPHESCA